MEHLGLAFQIADDLLDVSGDESATGKRVGSDRAKDKATMPSVLGLDATRIRADEEVARALSALDGFGPEAEDFRAVARYVVERGS